MTIEGTGIGAYRKTFRNGEIESGNTIGVIRGIVTGFYSVVSDEELHPINGHLFGIGRQSANDVLYRKKWKIVD